MFAIQVLLILCITFGAIVSPNPYEGECACGLENTQSRVFYGKEASYRKYPWLTYLEVDKNGGTSMCGGSLIDSRRILTAAHCVFNRTQHRVPAEDLYAYLGIQSVEDAEVSIKGARISHYEVNPHYPQYNGYDIALLVLKKPVKFTKYISPICIPAFESDETLLHKKLTVVGWGISHLERDENDPNNTIPMTSTVPMEAKVDFISKEDCAEMHHRQGESFSASVDASREICAYNFKTHADACGGDSGGPLMYKNRFDNRWYLAGVVSRGPDCPNHSGFPGIYTKLRSMHKSIRKMDTPEDFCQNY
ncbi:melanization protease 1-like [Brevipalpus obovatus]|uniref:melanization protease 1-like n=1 Tax=Brevipalpus obovatus TaxID=246614 RepID=UPI003D9EA6A8